MQGRVILCALCVSSAASGAVTLHSIIRREAYADIQFLNPSNQTEHRLTDVDANTSPGSYSASASVGDSFQGVSLMGQAAWTTGFQQRGSLPSSITAFTFDGDLVAERSIGATDYDGLATVLGVSRYAFSVDEISHATLTGTLEIARSGEGFPGAQFELRIFGEHGQPEWTVLQSQSGELDRGFLLTPGQVYELEVRIRAALTYFDDPGFGEARLRLTNGLLSFEPWIPSPGPTLLIGLGACFTLRRRRSV